MYAIRSYYGFEQVKAATDDDGRVDAAVSENCGHHAGGGGLAVGAGNGHAVLHAHQFGEHLGARDDRNQPAMGFKNLGVVGTHCRGGHHHVDIAYIFAAVAVGDLATERGQTPGDLALPEVGSGYLVTEIEQSYNFV